MRSLPLIAACTLGLGLVVACEEEGGGGSGGGSSGDGSGGVEASAGGSGTSTPGHGGEDSGTAGGASTVTCEGEAETLVADLGAWSVGLAASEDNIAYVTRVDAGSPTDLTVLGIDGSGQELIYTSAEGMAIESIAWSGGDVVFLEAADGEATSKLYRIAAAGGDPEQIGTQIFEEGRLLGADADFAYIYINSVNGTVQRVDLTSGAAETVGNVPAPYSLLHPSFEGGELFFVAGAGLSSAYRLDLTATDADSDVVFDGSGASGCTFPLGGLVATPTRLVCGYTDLAAFARDDGTAEGILIDGDLTRAAEHIPVAASGENIYMIQINDGTKDGILRRASSDGSDEVPLVCDQGQVSTQIVDGFFPLSNHYQIVVGGGKIIWVEERRAARGDDPTISLRSAAL